jgi:hypothetical protein
VLRVDVQGKPERQARPGRPRQLHRVRPGQCRPASSLHRRLPGQGTMDLAAGQRQRDPDRLQLGGCMRRKLWIALGIIVGLVVVAMLFTWVGHGSGSSGPGPLLTNPR